jgi:hypothetical protein
LILRFAWIAGMLAATAAPASSATTPSPSPPRVAISDLAPADEYFGHQRLSVLVIRHQIFTLKDDLHHARRRPDAIESTADSLVDAFDDWAARFPKDAWLPRTGWELATLYEELPGTAARDRAISLLTDVDGRYAETPFGASSAKDLARGVGVRPWPRWAGSPSPAPPFAASSPQTLVAATQRLQDKARDPHADGADLIKQTETLEQSFVSLSHSDGSEQYGRAAWQLAVLYESLPGADARERAIRMLAHILDRYPDTVYARWSLRDLERGVGLR